MLEECARALFVADREGARVHRFSLVSRAIEGARLFCWIVEDSTTFRPVCMPLRASWTIG